MTPWPKSSPSPDEVEHQRKELGLTQTEAAKLVHKKLRAWQKWEGGESAMDLALWELFLLKTGRIDVAGDS